MDKVLEIMLNICVALIIACMVEMLWCIAKIIVKELKEEIEKERSDNSKE